MALTLTFKTPNSTPHTGLLREVPRHADQGQVHAGDGGAHRPPRPRGLGQPLPPAHRPLALRRHRLLPPRLRPRLHLPGRGEKGVAQDEPGVPVPGLRLLPPPARRPLPRAPARGRERPLLGADGADVPAQVRRDGQRLPRGRAHLERADARHGVGPRGTAPRGGGGGREGAPGAADAVRLN